MVTAENNIIINGAFISVLATLQRFVSSGVITVGSEGD